MYLRSTSERLLSSALTYQGWIMKVALQWLWAGCIAKKESLSRVKWPLFDGSQDPRGQFSWFSEWAILLHSLHLLLSDRLLRAQSRMTDSSTPISQCCQTLKSRALHPMSACDEEERSVVWVLVACWDFVLQYLISTSHFEDGQGEWENETGIV